VPTTGFNPSNLQSAGSRYTQYTGLANKTLKIRYTEHIRYTRSNYLQVAHAVHALNNCHEYGLIDKIEELGRPFTEMSG
jgi:hypothetical protein